MHYLDIILLKNKIYPHFCYCAVVKEISRVLGTGLDDETLRICIQLCEAGVNPEALSHVIRELRREAATLDVSLSRQTL